MQLETAAESFRLSESKAKHYTVDSTYFFNTADLFSTAWRWQIFLWWNGLPGHNGRISRIDNSLATAAEHLATDFKHDGRQQVPTVGTYLQHKRHLVLLHTLHKCPDVKQPEKKHLLQLHVKSNTSSSEINVIHTNIKHTSEAWNVWGWTWRHSNNDVIVLLWRQCCHCCCYDDAGSGRI